MGKWVKEYVYNVIICNLELLEEEKGYLHRLRLQRTNPNHNLGSFLEPKKSDKMSKLYRKEERFGFLRVCRESRNRRRRERESRRRSQPAVKRVTLPENKKVEEEDILKF